MIEQGLNDLGLAVSDLTAIAFSRGPDRLVVFVSMRL